MPHSTGGGSSHSGSHSSSHSSSHNSGSSSSSMKSIYRSYMPGYTPYVYYDRNTKRSDLIYTNKSVEELNKEAKKNKRTKMIGIPILIILMIVSMLKLISLSVETRIKLTGTSESDIAIEDNLGIFSYQDKEEIESSLINFYNKTGIPIVFVTDTNDSWIDRTDSLEQWAYSMYLNRFDDEKHYLIVYTRGEPDKEGYADWYFEGMIGDDTESAFWSSEYDAFTEELQQCFYRSWTDHSQIAHQFAKAINNTVDNMKDAEFSMVFFFANMMAYGIFVYIFLFSLLISIISLSTKTYDGYVKAKADNDTSTEAPKTVHCEYCNGVYYVGSVLQCPYCAAPAITMEDLAKNSGSV